MKVVDTYLNYYYFDYVVKERNIKKTYKQELD
jgi:heme oxygenase